MGGVPSLPRRVAFDLDEGTSTLRLAFWPADTPNQARAFYSDRDLVNRVLALSAEKGRGAIANMHFGHFQRGYAWLAVPAQTDVAVYAHFWCDHPALIATTYEPGTEKPGQRTWDELIEALSEAAIIDSRESFDRDFVNTNRTRADIRPGLEIFAEWPLERAVELDETGALHLQVADAYARTLAAFGANPANPPLAT